VCFSQHDRVIRPLRVSHSPEPELVKKMRTPQCRETPTYMALRRFQSSAWRILQRKGWIDFAAVPILGHRHSRGPAGTTVYSTLIQWPARIPSRPYFAYVGPETPSTPNHLYLRSARRHYFSLHSTGAFTEARV